MLKSEQWPHSKLQKWQSDKKTKQTLSENIVAKKIRGW